MNKFYFFTVMMFCSLGIMAKGRWTPTADALPSGGDVITDGDVTLTLHNDGQFNKVGGCTPPLILGEIEKIETGSFIGGTANPVFEETSLVPTGGCFYEFTVTKDGIMDVAVKLSMNKAFRLICDEQNLIGDPAVTFADNSGYIIELVDDGNGDMILPPDFGNTIGKLSWPAVAGKTYYLYSKASKLAFGGFNFEQELPASPVTPSTPGEYTLLGYDCSVSHDKKDMQYPYLSVEANNEWLDAGTVLGSAENVKFTNLNGDTFTRTGLTRYDEIDEIGGVKIGSDQFTLSNSGISGTENPLGTTLSASATNGCIYMFEPTADGTLYITGRLSTDKSYYVFDDNDNLIAYSLNMIYQDADNYCYRQVAYTLPANADGHFLPELDPTYRYCDGMTLRQAITISNGLTEEMKHNGLGVISFPAKSGKKYKVYAEGSKMTCGGAIFIPSSVSQGVQEVGFIAKSENFPPEIFEEIEIIEPTNIHVINYVPAPGNVVKAKDITLTYSPTAGWHEYQDKQPYEYAGIHWDTYSVGDREPEFDGEIKAIPTGGVFYKVTAATNGAMYLPVVLWENKPLYIVDATGKNLVPEEVYVSTVADIAREWIPFTYTDATTGEEITEGYSVSHDAHMNPNIIRFNMEAGKEYYLYAKFSFLRICGFIFKPGETIVIPQKPEEINEGVIATYYTGNGETLIGWGNGSSVENVEKDAHPCLKFTKENASDNSWEAQVAINAPLTKDKTYKLTFDIKGTPATGITSSIQNSETYSIAGEFEPFDITDDWQRVTIEGTPTDNGTNRIVFNLGQYVGTFYMTNVFLYDALESPEFPELPVTEPAIEGVIASYYDGNGGTLSGCSNKSNVSDIELNGFPCLRWDGQDNDWIYFDANMAPNKTYILSFDVKAVYPFENITLALYYNDNIAGSNCFPVTTQWERVNVRLTPDFPGANSIQICSSGLNNVMLLTNVFVYEEGVDPELPDMPQDTNEGVIATYYTGNGKTLSGWGNGTFENVTKDAHSCLKFTQETATSNEWETQLAIEMPLTAYKAYRLTFDIKSNDYDRITSWIQNSEDYQIKGSFRNFETSYNWERVTIEGVPDSDGADRIVFNLGKFAGTFYMTNVFLYDALESPEFPELPEEVADPTQPTTFSIATPLAIGSSMQIKSFIEPETAADATVKWQSSDEEVAIVADGLVTGVGEGVVTIVANTDTDNPLWSTLNIYVYEAEPETVLVSSVEINPMIISDAIVGDRIQLNATVMPENANDKSLTWSSSDATVATVDEEGLVTIVAPGSAVITATANDAGGAKGICLVTGMSGIDDVVYTYVNEPKDVYTVDGKLIMRNASREEIKRLSQGIYLIGNQKIAIR